MSLDFWRDNNFRLEPWGSDYQPPIEIEQLEQTVSEVDANVEATNWSKFCQRPQKVPELPTKIILIDGRRRIDAALVGGSGDMVNYGAFGTVAVGAVIIDRNKRTPSCLYSPIQRLVGFGGSQEAPETLISCPLGSEDKLVYKPIKPHSENKPEIRRNLVQTEMLKTEAKLAQQFSSDGDTLVIRDGPLSYSSLPLTLGYIKTMHKNYLSAKYATLLWELQPGERTPIFEIKDKHQRFWSWYLKSGNSQTNNQRLGYHDLHGVVRLELSSDIPLEIAQKIADQTTYLIPEYSSHPYKDPRAPQNLIPVGALERELGRRMGDAHLIKRRLQHFLASVGVMT